MVSTLTALTKLVTNTKFPYLMTQGTRETISTTTHHRLYLVLVMNTKTLQTNQRTRRIENRGS